MMQERGENKHEHALGGFTISPRKIWTYTEKVAELSEELKAQKAKEESTGDATYVEEPQLRFTKSKL